MGGPNKQGGKGKGKGKGPSVGGSVMAQQFRAQMAKKATYKKQSKEGEDLGTVGVSKENKDLVLDVLKNIREDVDEKVHGLDSRPVKITHTTFVDGQEARELNGLLWKGIPKEAARTIIKDMPDRTTQQRLWPAVKLSMKRLCNELSGSMHDESFTADDAAMMRDDELAGLDGVLEPDVVTTLPDGMLEIKLNLQVPTLHAEYCKNLRLLLKGCTNGSYPATSPLALISNTETLNCKQFLVDANMSLWTKIVAELTGQPVIFELTTFLEMELPDLLEKHYPTPKASPAKGGKGKGGKGKGGNGKGGKSLKKNVEQVQQEPVRTGPLKKHHDLISDIIEEQRDEATDSKGTLKVPQLFPELSLDQVSTLSKTAASGGGRPWPGIENDDAENAKLKVRYEKRITKKEGLPEQRARLPAAKQEGELLSNIINNQVVLVTGETGCGKTTQVPQFVLDECIKNGKGSSCRIVCTQPRRISAVSIAKRVAAERGDTIGNQIGYSIRLETKQSKDTRLLFCTTGVLLRKLQSDKNLSTVSHIVVDEVHERSLDSDFLLIFLKDLITRRSDIKVVLMSASVNADLFSDYFNKCPVTHIPGFTHPVEVHHLESIIDLVSYTLEDDSPYANRGMYRSIFDSEKKNANEGLKELNARDEKHRKMWGMHKTRMPSASDRAIDVMMRLSDEKINNELITELIRHICQKHRNEEGAILVFLPGMQEINSLYEEIVSERKLAQILDCHRLHSTVSNQEQEAVFLKPRKGMRKVVLSTNIAETSVTIDDIVFVIDTGKHKENRYEADKGMTKLVSCWVSQANAKQRKGRAGRVRPGVNYRMYSSYTHNKVMLEFQECEMTRVPLQNLLLQIRVLNFGDSTDIEVLQKAIESPADSSIKSCRGSLMDIGALGPASRLTSLGAHLANLPVDPKLGKLLLHGVLLKCLDPCLTIAATLQSKSPFVMPYDRKLEADQAKMAIAQNSKSDHLTVTNAYNSWLLAREENRAKEREFCNKNFVSAQSMGQIQQTKRQFYSLLCDQKVITGNSGAWRTADNTGEPHLFEFGGKELNQYSAHQYAVRAALTAGFTPSVVTAKKLRSGHHVYKEQNVEVQVHPSSVVGREKQLPHPILVYYEKVQTSAVFIRDVTMISPQMLMLFAVELEHNDGNVLANNWISFKMDPEVLAVISELRKELQKILVTLMQVSDVTTQTKHANIIAAVMKLLRDERATGS